MTDTDKIQKIEQIVNNYIEDTDHWADYFMEQVCDVIHDTYNEQNWSR